jgi:Cu+-exporting ATPase
MIKKEETNVNGMSCAACAITVKKAIENTPGVISVNVNLATNKATFTYDQSVTSLENIFKNVEKVGYSLSIEKKEELDELKTSRRRLILSIFLLIPLTVIMAFSMFGRMIPFMDFLDLIFSGLMIFVIGFPVLDRAFKALIHGSLNMDILIAIGTSASYLTGVTKIFGLRITSFSYVGGMIMFFHLLGKHLETLAKGRTTQAIKSLLEIGAKNARIIVDGKEVEVQVSQLDIEDIMIIKPGEKIPTDGIIIEGITTLDESMATGESLPVSKSVGDEVIGGTINQLGSIKVKVTKIGPDTFLSQLIKLVYDAQSSKVPVQEFADKVISYFVPTVLLISFLVFLFWFFFPDAGRAIIIWGSSFIPWINLDLNQISQAIFASVATLVIACPCALGLATPTALIVSSGLGARNGILIRNGTVIQTMKDVNTIVFDKTGTITYGKPELIEFYDFSPDGSGFRILFSIEKLSEHPIAKAIVRKGENEGIEPFFVEGFTAIPGIGIKGRINGKEYIVKKPDKNVSNKSGEEISEIIEKIESSGETALVLFQEENILCIAGVGDRIKEEAKEVIEKLKSLHIVPVMLTGDNERTAKSIAKKVGIDIVKAEVLPKDKLQVIKSLQKEGSIIAFVGDGINDAPAIKQANVGIAMGTGTDIAIEAGDIVIVSGNLNNIIKAINLSIKTFRKIRENLFWAFFYNIIAIPVAAVGFLHPVIAEIAMALSSINVVTNSLRLNELKL